MALLRAYRRYCMPALAIVAVITYMVVFLKYFDKFGSALFAEQNGINRAMLGYAGLYEHDTIKSERQQPPGLPQNHNIIDKVEKVQLAKQKQRFYSYRGMTDFILGRPGGSVFRDRRDNHTLDMYRVPEFKWIINNKSLCSSQSNLNFVLTINSEPSNFEARVILRTTWARGDIFNGFKFVTVFFLPKIDDKDMQIKIKEESNLYGDIVQVEFIDSFQYSSLKTIAMLKWLRDFCNSPTLVLKSDDDVYIDMFQVYNLINLIKEDQGKNYRKCMIGDVYPAPPIMRDLKSKWGVPATLFPNDKLYPNHMLGKAYLFTMDLVREMYGIAMKTPMFYIEDVYLTGLIANQVRGLAHFFYSNIKENGEMVGYDCGKTFFCRTASEDMVEKWCNHTAEMLHFKMYQPIVLGSKLKTIVKKQCNVT